MREVIQKVVATETKAKRMVEEARAEGERILLEARKKAEDLSSRAYYDAGAEADRIVSAAMEEAEKEKEESLQRAAAVIESQVGIDESGRKGIVDEIVRYICRQ